MREMSDSQDYVTVYEILGARIDRLEALLREWRRKPMGELDKLVMRDLCERTDRELEKEDEK